MVGQLIHKNELSIGYKIIHNIKSVNIINQRELSNRTFGHQWFEELLLHVESHYLFGDFLHQNSVVSFGGDARVCKGYPLSQSVHREKALSSTPLHASRSHVPTIPAHKWLDEAA